MLIAADATAQSTVFYTPFNDKIQFQGPYGLLGARVEYRPRSSSVDYRRVHPKRHEHGLHDGDLWDGAHGLWRTSWPLAYVSVEFTVRR